MENVGFIGLGVMGLPMAKNLVRAGYPLTATSRTLSKGQSLLTDGASLVATPAEVAKVTDVVLICVTDGPDVEAVLFGEDGALMAASPGSLIVDMSTISPRLTVDLARRTREAKVHFIDAPVSGGQAGAVEARLSIMVGGEASDLERALPILQNLGKTITHMGPVGAGQATKLANQIAVAINLLGVAEALSFARSVGLDADLTRQVIAGGAGSSWTMQNSAPKIIARDFRPGFSIDLLQKDLGLVIETAHAASTPVLGTSLVHQLYSVLQRNGGGRESALALIKALERLAGETASADT